MKDKLQIKTTLFEFQHDALMAFYETYPKMVANKVLLRLCEACLPIYPPTLAHFNCSEPKQDAKTRKVSIAFSKEESPLLWDFYNNELPHGARANVMTNILNAYAQYAEADKTILENAYWKKSIVTAEDGVATLPVSESGTADGRADQVSPLVAHEKPNNSHQPHPQPEPVPVEASDGDPLLGINSGL